MTDNPEVAAIRAKLDGRMTDADPWNGTEVEMLLDALDERDKEIARLKQDLAAERTVTDFQDGELEKAEQFAEEVLRGDHD